MPSANHRTAPSSRARSAISTQSSRWSTAFSRTAASGLRDRAEHVVVVLEDVRVDGADAEPDATRRAPRSVAESSTWSHGKWIATAGAAPVSRCTSAASSIFSNGVARPAGLLEDARSACRSRRSPRTASRSRARRGPPLRPGDDSVGSWSLMICGRSGGSANPRVEARTISSGTNVTPRCSCSSSVVSASSSSAAGPAELVARLAHRGERHRGRGRELDVVVADDRHVVGDADARRANIACSTPSASRSLAQKTAVGRSRRPSRRSPASRPAATSALGGELGQRRSAAARPPRARPARRRGGRATWASERAADVGDRAGGPARAGARRRAGRPRRRPRRPSSASVSAGRGRRARRGCPARGRRRGAGRSWSSGVIRTPRTRCSAKQREVVGPRGRRLRAVADHTAEPGLARPPPRRRARRR